MIVIETKRDRRVLDWLIAQAGEAAVATACAQVAGARRAYPSNVARVLGLRPPRELATAADEDARRHIEAIATLLGVREVGGGSNGAP